MMDIDSDLTFFSLECEVQRIIRDCWINIGLYKINTDGSLDVTGNVKFAENMNFTTDIPLVFNKVSGDFDCSRMNLRSLKGSPKEVGGVFNCTFNQLESLAYVPKIAHRFIFDNTVQSLCTGGVNCQFDGVTLLHLSDNFPKVLPEKISSNYMYLKTFFKYQNYYCVWNHQELNEKNFDLLINDIQEGLK
ncbi:hypothetical protein [Flavobacterium hibisci]|uniref:hypothetical protein n=1 Tax=Flavobacterium hibisci TaxID=1914462 RepID=UPI001CBC4C02|nr:hypothetical protein [Flavobacterium hibisci]MBZ4042586.1 hypothetical protein [Flavobacterium hibisci]